LGLAIKTTVFEEEALREGYTQSWSSLDAMTQKQIIYNTIMDRSNILLQNSGDYTQTAAGKMRKAASDVQDATISVGATTAGVFTQIKAGWADFLKLIGPGLQALEELLILGFAQWTQFWSDVVYVFINAQKLLTGKETIEQFEAAMRGLGDFSKKAFQDAIQGGSEFFGLIQKDLTDGTGAVESIAAGYGDALTQIEQQEEAAQTKMESDLVTFEKNVKDIYDTANKDRLNAETDYTRKMVDVETSYQRDISSIEIDYANRRYEDAVKFNENQYTKEEQFQEQMHQLREKYLYDLDDAVRARDARKVLDLNRQYNEDRLIAVQKYDEEKQLAEQQYQWELQALAREEAARIKARQVELANERADAALALKQKLSDIDPEEKYKLQKLEEGFAAEEALAAQYGDQVYKILAKYYGPGGAVDQLYAYFSTALQRLAQVSSMATAAASSLATTGYPVNYNQPWTLPGSGVAKPYAEGGTLIATHPTSAIFGDAGPEKVTFTPLSRQGADVGRVFGGGDAVGGKATVTIALTEGLKGEIIDNTLAAAAVELQQAEV
jgi:ketosteroid isomerase-like protein